MQVLPPPQHKLKLNKFSLDTLLSKNIYFDSFPIHAVHVLIPGSEKLYESSKENLMLSDDTYFIVKNISLTTLIQELSHFIKTGSLYAFSYGANAESENFVTVIPSGKLILSLEATIADSLSLKKEKPNKQKKRLRPSHQTYEIDINCEDFLPGKKLYQTILSELNKLEHIKFDLLLRWQPTGNVCPQSIRNHLESQGFDCVVYESNLKHHSIFTVPIPKIDFSLFDQYMADDLVEWIGTQVCGIEYSEDSDSYTSNFTVPEPSTILKKLQIGSFEGFFSREHICNLLKYIREMFKTDPHLPFIAMSISGYQDCYVISSGYQKFISGDKVICLIFSPALDCWIVSLNT